MTAGKAMDADQMQPGQAAEVPGSRRGFRGILLTPRSRPVFLTGLAILLVFSGFRVGLFVGSWALVQSVGLADIGHSLLMGLRFDLKALGYMLLPMVLLVSIAPAGAFTRRWFRCLLTVYASTMILLALAGEIIGTYFFLYFGRRLNSMALQYLEHYNEILGHIFSQYPVWLLVVAGAVGLAGSCLLFHKLFWSASLPRRNRHARLAHGLVMVTLCVLAIRSINGSTYFTNNNLVNELSRNNLATFASAVYFSVTGQEGRFFPFPAGPDGCRKTAKMLYLPTDMPLPDATNPLWRVTDSGRPVRDLNVVLIIMESMAGRSVGALGHRPDYTPHLTALCEQGIYFENMYATGYQTHKGLAGILCGHPGVGGQRLMKRPEAVGHIRTLPTIFADRGYRTMFFYGGDPEFDNMRQFLANGGIQEQYCQDAMPGGPRGGFGYAYHDEVVFDKAHEVFDQAGDRRFFAVILTLSNHDPWEVPIGRTDTVATGADAGPMQNGYRYADWALHRFFQKARQARAAWLDNTLFVLVADHGQRIELDRTKLLDAPGFRIPCLFYAPGVADLTPRRRIQTVCSQVDVAPTLLSLLGGPFEHSFLGRDILSVEPGDGFAMLRDFDPIGFVRGDRLVIRPPRSWPRLYRLDRDAMHELDINDQTRPLVESLDQEMLAYYGTARYLLGQRALEAPVLDPAADGLQALRAVAGTLPAGP